MLRRLFDNSEALAVIAGAFTVLARTTGRPEGFLARATKHAAIGSAAAAAVAGATGYTVSMLDDKTDEEDYGFMTAMCAAGGALAGAVVSFATSLAITAFKR